MLYIARVTSMYWGSFRVPTRVGTCVYCFAISFVNPRDDITVFSATGASTKERIVVVDRRRNHKASRYCYRIWNIRAFSHSLSKVPDRKFFCRREQWIKRRRGRSILPEEHRWCAEKIFFLCKLLALASVCFCTCTHIGSIDTHKMDFDDVKTEEESTTNDLNTFPLPVRFIFTFKDKARKDRTSRASGWLEENGQTRAIRRKCIRVSSSCGLSLHLFHGLARACRHILCHGRGPGRRTEERRKENKESREDHY